ncbi:Ankyrin repeats (3 copies) [Popillia japonica]|uniref:Ankyrin repeats (3 copies) n=1 Tax=Popillia japonica TaxID=7064 RepID=A0AAW1LQT6_POPJA
MLLTYLKSLVLIFFLPNGEPDLTITMTIDHAALIAEMPHIEQMPTQERLILARERRTKQLQSYHRREREYGKKPKGHRSSKRRIHFRDSVVLLEAAARNDIEEVRNLLYRGVDADSCNEDGLTALHQCCIDDNEAMLLLLLEHGANVNAVDSEKWTPLHAAATCGHLKLVSILIARGANLLAVNADGNMPYDICEDEAALDYIEGEMAKRGVTQKLIDETRAHTEMQMLLDLQKMVARGEDLETCDKQGATPLHISAANGYITVVEYLLDQNVRTDAQDKDDWQPAHAAACWGHLDVLEMLVQAGADLNAKNKYDETPADICEDPEIKERIVQLRTEQESKRQAADRRKKVRKSSSNTRTQSVRRTSSQEKRLTQRRDAVEEARLRMQAEYKGLETANGQAPNAATTVVSNGKPYNVDQNNVVSSNNELVAVKSPVENRKPPEGKDNSDGSNGDLVGTEVIEFTINGNGTLADLKKQRMQIRNSSSADVSNLNSPASTIETESITSPPNTDFLKLAGDTDDVVGYNMNRSPFGCCTIQ